jgi:phasin family protein
MPEEHPTKAPISPVAAPAIARAAKAAREASAHTANASFAAASQAGAAVQDAAERAGAAFPGFLKDFDFSKVFSDLKVPAMPDMEAVLITHKRNLEALSEANRVALEGAQAVGKRHLEIMQSTMAELADSMKSLSVSDAPAARAAKQAELLKHAYESAVTNARELGDLIQRSNAEAMQKLNHRFSEAMNELQTLFNKR